MDTSNASVAPMASPGSSTAGRSTPVSVAVLNDFDVVVQSTASMLGRYDARVRVTDDLESSVALIDAFAAQPTTVATWRAVAMRSGAVGTVILARDTEGTRTSTITPDASTALLPATSRPDDIVAAIEAVSRSLWRQPVEVASPKVRGPVHRFVEPLSDRELEVVAYMADGLRNAEIADLLGVSSETVKTYASRAYSKIGARNRAQAAAWAISSGVHRRPPTGEPPAV